MTDSSVRGVVGIRAARTERTMGYKTFPTIVQLTSFAFIPFLLFAILGVAQHVAQTICGVIIVNHAALPFIVRAQNVLTHSC